MTEAEKAYAFAEKLIAQAWDSGAEWESGAESLSFDTQETHALEVLPKQISGLTSLEELDLENTRISDLSPLKGLVSLTTLWLRNTEVSDVRALSGLTSLTTLVLDDTPVSDISALSRLTALTNLWLTNTNVEDLTPLLGLTLLVEKPGFYGLTFKRCAAAKKDARIAEISEIADDSGRAHELFAYLKSKRPKPEAARSSHTPLADSTAQISTSRIKAVLKDSYPDIKARAAHLVGLIQQQRAVHALIPAPNKADQLEEYRAEEELLKTLDAGLVSLYEDLPEVTRGVVSDAEATKFRDRLVKLATLADKTVRYLDADKGTYGGLWKIGLISAIGGVLALVPGVSFIAGAAISGATIGAQTVRLQVSRE